MELAVDDLAAVELEVLRELVGVSGDVEHQVRAAAGPFGWETDENPWRKILEMRSDVANAIHVPGKADGVFVALLLLGGLGMRVGEDVAVGELNRGTCQAEKGLVVVP